MQLDKNTSLINKNIVSIEERTRNISRPDSNVSLPKIVVTRNNKILDRSKLSVLKSHRGKRPGNLKLDHNENSLLGKETPTFEVESNKSLKFLIKYKKSSK